MLDVLESLEKQISKQNSLKFAFARGMVYGLGTVIGATVLVALFGGVIISLVNTFTDEPIDEAALERVLSE